MISIIIPAYNEAKYIEECIFSILQQSFKDIEVIVVDDGSTDNTLEILNHLCKLDQRLKVYSPGKLGKNGACNFGASKAKGEWFSIFAADDIMEEGILEDWIAAVSEYDPTQEIIVVLSRIKMFSNDKKYMRYNGLEIPKNKNKVCRSGAAYMGSRKMLEDMFPIPTRYPNEDGWMALYIEFLVPKIIAVKKICTNYRIHDNNSLNKNAPFKEFNEKYHIRRIVTGEFLENYRNKLTKLQQNILSDRYHLESLRYNGKFFRVLFFSRCDFVERMRNIFLSNSFLYNIKLMLNRIFLGNA